MEIESRLLPCGLHVVGVPPTAEEAIATLVNIAELDRPGEGTGPWIRLCLQVQRLKGGRVGGAMVQHWLLSSDPPCVRCHPPL